MRSLLRSLPVTAHQLVRPGRLAHGFSRKELGHDRLDVDHWRSVGCVESLDPQPGSFAPENRHDCDAKTVRAPARALREDSDFRPGRIIPWMPGACNDRLLVDAIARRLPAAPRSWGLAPDLGSLSDDARTAITDGESALEDGAIHNVWQVAPGDPVGRYVIKVTVEGAGERTFEFEVR